MSDLEFDAATHTYRYGGVVVPNVTRILSPLQDFSRIDPAVLENARQEGTDIHRAVELAAKNDLDEDTLPEWLRPKLAAYKRFVADVGFELIASEHRLYHRQFAYAGTLDLLAKFRNERQAVCVDIKRSLYAGRSVGLQTAAYSMAWEDETKEKVGKRFALVLGDNTYRLTEFNDSRDRSVFLAMLTVHKWRGEVRSGEVR